MKSRSFVKFNNWLTEADNIDWHIKPKINYKKNKKNSFIFFPDGKLNVYDNCIKNNILRGFGKKIAVITIDNSGKVKKFNYNQIDQKVNRFSSLLFSYFKKQNISNPRIICHASSSLESAVTMLACAKMGYHFSVIFEDLGKEAITKRIKLLDPDLFITRQEKQKIKTKFQNLNFYKKNVFSYKDICNFNLKNNSIPKSKSIFSGADFFTLFTSGSTGIPKGIVHTTAGYLTYSKFTCKEYFGMNSSSIVLTASDAGWINGHTYALFGPLSFGATTVLLESPNLVLNEKILDKILKLKITILYLPVTIIRLARAIYKNKKIKKIENLTLGSMGEPLAPSVGKWFAEKFSKKNNSIVNTYFQTETGGIISAPKYNEKINQSPHGSVGRPVTRKLKINKLLKNEKKEFKIISPWPGCMKRVLNKNTWKNYWDSKNNFRMFDLATVKNNAIIIHGRTDDVINIRGHRIGSEELESVVLRISNVYESCAVSTKDKLEGSVIFLFVVSKDKKVHYEIEKKINENFGSFAIPKKIYFVKELPKTKSGKILRRLLRELIEMNYIKSKSDKSTIANLKLIDHLVETIKNN
jgi:acetyl-CoA synthetase